MTSQASSDFITFWVLSVHHTKLYSFCWNIKYTPKTQTRVVGYWDIYMRSFLVVNSVDNFNTNSCKNDSKQYVQAGQDSHS